MKRTPLLLMFGEHSRRSSGVEMPANRKFFRSMVNPFIDGHFSGGGKKAAIVHEYNTMVDITGMTPEGVNEESYLANVMGEGAAKHDALMRLSVDAKEYAVSKVG